MLSLILVLKINYLRKSLFDLKMILTNKVGSDGFNMLQEQL